MDVSMKKHFLALDADEECQECGWCVCVCDELARVRIVQACSGDLAQADGVLRMLGRSGELP